MCTMLGLACSWVQSILGSPTTTSRSILRRQSLDQTAVAAILHLKLHTTPLVAARKIFISFSQLNKNFPAPFNTLTCSLGVAGTSHSTSHQTSTTSETNMRCASLAIITALATAVCALPQQHTDVERRDDPNYCNPAGITAIDCTDSSQQLISSLFPVPEAIFDFSHTSYAQAVRQSRLMDESNSSGSCVSRVFLNVIPPESQPRHFRFGAHPVAAFAHPASPSPHPMLTHLARQPPDPHPPRPNALTCFTCNASHRQL